MSSPAASCFSGDFRKAPNQAPFGRIALGLGLAALLATTPSIDGIAAQNWQLVWNDEFDGSTIDSSRWEHEVNGDGGGNNELQYYTARPENSFVSGGALHIRALREEYRGRSYTSARLRTKTRGDWTYGRFEARARLPKGQGLWPAFWMLPTDWEFGGWASSGEIDIMELVGHEPRVVYGTIHYGGEWPDNTSSGGSYRLSGEQDFSDDFHTFALEWEPEELRWYVDGHHYLTQRKWHSEGGEFPAPFNRRFHLLLNVAVGGDWPGSPGETTVFPQEMVVDYVRVYRDAETAPGWQVPGDANQDGSLDVSDALAFLDLLFGGADLPCGGLSISSAGNRSLLDVNGDGGIDLSDPVYELLFLFAGGPAPVLGDECTQLIGCSDACSPRCDAPPDVEPALTLTHVPACGTDEDLEGAVCGLDPASHYVVAYVNVCGQWWGPKPSFSEPITDIGTEGEWTVDVTTGGADPHALEQAVFVLARASKPPRVEGAEQLPDSLLDSARASAVVNRGCVCP